MPQLENMRHSEPRTRSFWLRYLWVGTALLCMTTTLSAQYEGTYRVPTQWGDMTLTLRQSKHEIRGQLLGYDGNLYRVEGNSDDEFAEGLVYGPAGNSEFELYFDSTDSTWYLDLEPEGSFQSSEFIAHKLPASEAADSVIESDVTTETPAMRDARLVGTWAYQEVMTGGGHSVTTRMVMRFLPNGLFVQGDATSAASGADYGLAFGAGIGTQTGFWRASDGQLQASMDGITYFPLAAYEIRGASLLLRYYDGTQQLWSRIA